MNILITNVDGQPAFTGGIKRVSTLLANAWVAMGHHVCFLGLLPPEMRSNYTIVEGISQVFLPNYDDVCSAENQAYLHDYIISERIDIVLNQHIEDRGISNLCFAVKAKVSGTRWISALHFSPTSFIDEADAYHNHPSGLTRWHWRSILMRYKWQWYGRKQVLRDTAAWYKRVYEHSDHTVVLSNHFIAKFAHLAGVTPERISGINNPIPPMPMIVPTPKEKLVVWCGRLGGCKRLDYMLSIWRSVAPKHTDWKLVVLGSGDVPYWQGFVREHDIPNVDILGFTDPFPYYQRASIFCLTSSTEGFGMVLTEAMSYGCATIAFESYEALHDIITDQEHGVIVPFPDEAAYARALAELMEQPIQREAMAQRSAGSLIRFSLEKIAQQWLHLFSDISST